MHPITRLFIATLLGYAAILPSCATEDNSLPNDPEYGNIPPALIEILQEIGPEVQEIQIDPTRDTIIQGKNGTTLFISANSLTDENGSPVTSPITITLKENNLFSDFIASNLQTVHDGDLLQTQGMLYFSAQKADGSTVSIDPNKPIRIEFPVEEKIEGTQIFSGTRDENGRMNWSEYTEPSKYLVPFPIQYISQNRIITECPNNYGISTDLAQNPYYYGDLNKFENTLLATREFKERFEIACQPEILEIYINNLDKDLWKIDEMVVKYYLKDSAERVNLDLELARKMKKKGNWTPEQEAANQSLINSSKEYGHSMISAFRAFAKQKLTTIDPKIRNTDTTLTLMSKAMVAYDATAFGWVNVDIFYNDPNAAEIKLIAKTNKKAPVVDLLLPRQRIMVMGNYQNDNSYSFTQNEMGYNKLPKGEKAIIVAISIEGDQLLYAEKKITIGKQETESVELKPITLDKLKTELKKLGK